MAGDPEFPADPSDTSHAMDTTPQLTADATDQPLDDMQVDEGAGPVQGPDVEGTMAPLAPDKTAAPDGEP
jgi:hypothetical protein